MTAETAANASTAPNAVPASSHALCEQRSRFLRPVYAGDTLRCLLEVSELVPGRTTGVLAMRSTVHNQRGELVMDGEQRYLLKRRTPLAAG